ncbi:hypothetical protein LJC74_06585 [Eubacteriales bacterium OttesenSCG-928-A19]|nr:hypothetical protein [Eubacteriales bacterium OttesenSCG-928-A19]
MSVGRCGREDKEFAASLLKRGVAVVLAAVLALGLGTALAGGLDGEEREKNYAEMIKQEIDASQEYLLKYAYQAIYWINDAGKGDFTQIPSFLTEILAGLVSSEDLSFLADGIESGYFEGVVVPDWLIIVGPGQVIDELEIGEGQVVINCGGEIKSLTATGSAVYIMTGGATSGSVTLRDSASLYIADVPSAEEIINSSNPFAFSDPALLKPARVHNLTATDESQVYLGNNANVAAVTVMDDAKVTVHPDGIVWSVFADEESQIVTGYNTDYRWNPDNTVYNGTINPLPQTGAVNEDEVTTALVASIDWMSEADRALLARILSGALSEEDLRAMREAGELPSWLHIVFSDETAERIDAGEGMVTICYGAMEKYYGTKNSVCVMMDGASAGYIATGHDATVITRGGGQGVTVDRVHAGGASTVYLASYTHVKQLFIAEKAFVLMEDGGTVDAMYANGEQQGLDGYDGDAQTFHGTLAENQARKEAIRLAQMQAQIDAYNAAYGLVQSQNDSWVYDDGASGGGNAPTGPSTPTGPGTPTNPDGSLGNPYLLSAADLANLGSAGDQGWSTAVAEYVNQNSGNISVGTYYQDPAGGMWVVDGDENGKGVTQLP